MLIDAHVHLLPDRLIEAIRRWFDEHAWDIQYRFGVEQCIATLKAGGVRRMVALPYAHKPGMAQALNAFTLELARRHPEVVPCCTVFPGEEGDERILEEALGSGDFHGVKVHSHVQRVAPDDPRLDPVWRASARHRRPVVFHCGREPASPGYGIDVHTVSGASRLRRALSRHPEAVCVVPHLGADEYVEMEAMLDEFPNLYLDTAMAVGGAFEGAMQIRSAGLDLLGRRPGRILYGSDFPNLPYEWTRELRVIEGLGLAAGAKAALLGGTAARLFGIA
jgi:predicted TIM-barrel fold metal-dependent hydrolase